MIGIAKGVDGVKKAEGQIQATGSIVVDGKYVTGSGGAPNLVFSYVTEPFSNSSSRAGARHPRARWRSTRSSPTTST